MRTLLASLTVLAAVWARPADACGCFTPPDPTVPVVQAGERILFSVDQGQVTAHIQVQYSGATGNDFGWLLPLPSVPTLELGTDELFAQLLTATQPRYRLTVTRDSSCLPVYATGGGTAFGGGTGGASGGFVDAGSSGPPLVVVQDSVGPYDYAVLRGDSKAEMLAWLNTNHYFVPNGTDDAVTPYIHAGGYFLALKLKSGATTGDLQPVVLRYQSDFGFIPITLTSTGAQPNMGVQVWMLGAGRAIPRNYQHTVLNDARLDWQSAGANYNDLVIAAVNETPEHHTFVTEYAGSATPVRTAMAPPRRFGTKAELAALPDATAFIEYLWSHGFAAPTPLNASMFIGPSFSGTLKNILSTYLPPPATVDAENFYRSYGFYVSQAPAQNYQPQAMADAIWERVVVPTQQAAALFTDSVTLTRLYTTMSPSDMNRDPAFSFNASLPLVSNVHQATMTVSCEGNGYDETRAMLVTEQGWRVVYPHGRFQSPELDPNSLPASLVVEVLREEGVAEVVVDNRPVVKSSAVGTELPRAMSCSVVGPGVSVLAVLVAFGLRRRREVSPSAR